MNLHFKYSIILLFCTTSTFSLSQNKILINTLPLILIENQQISSILDSFMVSEKKCEYYNVKLVFLIHVRKDSDTKLYLTIDSYDDSNTVQRIHPAGFLELKGHFVFIFGILTDDLFSKTIQTRKFYYKKARSLIIDDSFSQWNYEKKDGFFYPISKFNFCN